MKFRKKPVVIEAITFDEFIQYGCERDANIVNGMPWSFKYKGHAVSHERDDCYLIPTLEGTHNFTPADMLITGVAGEIYPCKLDIFAATYESEELLREPLQATSLTFGSAVEALKQGKKLARAGWNGKGMFVFLVSGSTFNVNRAPLLGIFPEGTEINYRPHIDIKNVDGSISTWVPSIGDVMAEDWSVL